jgi:hypothetical protein
LNISTPESALVGVIGTLFTSLADCATIDPASAKLVIIPTNTELSWNSLSERLRSFMRENTTKSQVVDFLPSGPENFTGGDVHARRTDAIYLLTWFYNQRTDAENLIKEANNDRRILKGESLVFRLAASQVHHPGLGAFRNRTLLRIHLPTLFRVMLTASAI